MRVTTPPTNEAIDVGGSRNVEADAVSRVQQFDWGQVATELEAFGCARLEQLLTAEECREVAALYSDDARFRSRVVMASHGFGKGEYKYFRYPLPSLVARLRSALYPELAVIANRWNEAMKIDVRYPERHTQFLERCHAAGQDKPTPLLLQYREADYNCLHQDLYGEHVFPIQLASLLSEPGEDFTGGEFVLTEQRPRTRRRRGLRRLPPSCERDARDVSGQHAAWGQPPAFGHALYLGNHFSRCEVEKTILSICLQMAREDCGQKRNLPLEPLSCGALHYARNTSFCPR